MQRWAERWLGGAQQPQAQVFVHNDIEPQPAGPENLDDDADPEVVIANPGVAAEGAEGVNVVDPADRPEGEHAAEVKGDDRLTPEQVRILIDKARQDEKARIDKEYICINIVY